MEGKLVQATASRCRQIAVLCDPAAETFHNYELRIVSAHGNNAQRALEMVGVDRDIRIGDEHLEAQPAGFGIDQRLDERMSGREPLAFELALDPVEEDLELGFAVGEPMELFGLSGQVPIADVLLDGISRLPARVE